MFFFVAIVAAIFGFGGKPSGGAAIAKVLFFVSVGFALLSLVLGRRART